jgi:hypothetical protein
VCTAAQGSHLPAGPAEPTRQPHTHQNCVSEDLNTSSPLLSLSLRAYLGISGLKPNGGIGGKLVHFNINPLHSTLIPLQYSSTQTNKT